MKILNGSSWLKAPLFVGLILGIATCSRPSKELGDDYMKPQEAQERAAKVKSKLAALDKIKPAAVPPTQTDAVQLTNREIGSRTLDHSLLGMDSADTFWVYDVDLANPGKEPDNFPHRLKGTGRSSGCAFRVQLFDKGRPVEKDPGFAGCENIKYVAVVRMTTNKDPELASREGTTQTFIPGSVVGDVLIFDLETAKHLGGFRYSARNSDNPNWDQGMMDSIHADLEQNTRKAIEEAFDKALSPVGHPQ